ncbi:MAG: polysaccharide deacetylase family protein [Chloroflexi bacterium]|nr:polysaccharide deacetylase family protein [Chloroflexota bacterium]
MITLLYHRIGTDDHLAVHPQRFRWQMAWLAQHPTVTYELTFDDGTIDFANTAWPILMEYGLSATLFVVAGKVGGRADWSGGSGAPLLDWGDLAHLAAQGVTIGAHGLHHRPLDQLPPAEQMNSLRTARDRLASQLGLAPAGLAYPYGRHDAQVCASAAEAGFTHGYTARSGPSVRSTGPYRLRRTLITADDTPVCFVLKVRSGYADLTDIRMDLRRLP